MGPNSDCINSPGLSQSLNIQLESCITFGAEAQTVSASLGKFTFPLYLLLLVPKLKKIIIIVLCLVSLRSGYLHDILYKNFSPVCMYSVLLCVKTMCWFSGDF